MLGGRNEVSYQLSHKCAFFKGQLTFKSLCFLLKLIKIHLAHLGDSQLSVYLTLDFGSGHDLTIVRSSSTSGSW